MTVQRWEREDRDIRALLRKLMRGKTGHVSRVMSEKLGKEITSSMLFDFTRPGKKAARFPLCYLSAFSEAVQADDLRLHLLGPRLLELLRLGESVAVVVNTNTRRKLVRRQKDW